MLTRLLDHLAWADALVLASLRAMPAGTAGHARAVRLYAHLAAAEHVWLARLVGEPARYPVWPDLDLDAAAALAAESTAGLARLAASLSPAGAAREVEYRTSAGQPFRGRVDDLLLHVALHGSHHRGQIALLARDGGGTPASTDYVTWTRGVPAPPATGADPARSTSPAPRAS